MRRLNEKGFVIEGTFAIIALISLATLAVFSLTPAKNLINIGGDGGQKTTQTQNYKETMEPVLTKDGSPMAVQTADGQEAYLFKRTKSSATLDQTIKPELTLWQKLLQLGWWWIALTIAGFFWGPLGTVMNMINTKAKNAAIAAAAAAKARYEAVTGHAHDIVISVDAGLDAIDAEIQAAQKAADTVKTSMSSTTDVTMLAVLRAQYDQHMAVADALAKAKDEFMWALKDKQDGDTKALVAELRQMGHSGGIGTK